MSDRPTKEVYRKWLTDQVKSHKPLPSQRELRRQLGKEMIEIQRQEAEKKRNK